MKKVLSILLITSLVILGTVSIILSTVGIETDKFNKLISRKISESNKNIKIKLNTIKFKLDIKEISLFLETNEPFINYRNATIPAKNLKVYIDFFSLVKSETQIEKINVILNEMNIQDLNNISFIFKPSNLKSFIKNKIKYGKLNSEIDIYLNENNQLDNFIARGSVIDLKGEIIRNLNFEETKFTFFADKSDILIKNFFSKAGPVEINDGDIKIKLLTDISIETNFVSNLKYDENFVNYYSFLKNKQIFENLINLEANFNNNFLISFDNTYKLKDFSFSSRGKLAKIRFLFKDQLELFPLQEKIKDFSIINSIIETKFNSKGLSSAISGEYSLNNNKPLMFNIENFFYNKKTDLIKLDLDLDYEKIIKLEMINYTKPSGDLANFSINLKKQKNKIEVIKMNFKEGENLISINGVKLNKGKFLSLSKIFVKTKLNGNENNNFSVSIDKKISITGKKFDARNLPKILSEKSRVDYLSNISKEIDIDIKNIIAPLSEKLKDFKLIGNIEKGQFVKITSKGDFGGNNYLDISMKSDKRNEKKYLEIYSDLTKPLLTEYSFFKGLTGGKLLYSSIIDEKSSNSKLLIENFKVINAPGMVKLLSLADLGGLADLAEGDGISFDVLEIKMEKNPNILKLNEILALGPSISVLIEGYQDSSVTSLRGTLVPAKTLNKLISKIPLIGDIVIPKEVGEGLFGISFKMKGPPGNIKTTINPIRTITPRFIQKIIDKNKNFK